jgi:hypothetical protein
MNGYSARVETVVGPEVNVLQCLWCGQRPVRAQTRQETGWLKFLYLIPLLRIRNVYVRCGACRKDMTAKCAFAALSSMSPVTLQHCLVKSRSFVGASCIVLGALLYWAPLIGIIPAIIGFCYRKQFGRAMRVTSTAGLILSLLTTGLGIAAMFLAQPKG